MRKKQSKETYFETRLWNLFSASPPPGESLAAARRVKRPEDDSLSHACCDKQETQQQGEMPVGLAKAQMRGSPRREPVGKQTSQSPRGGCWGPGGPAREERSLHLS